MKAWMFVPAVSVAAALAMVPQDPAGPVDPPAADPSAIVSMSELRYTTLQGAAGAVSARNVVEIRLFEDHPHHIRLEMIYENGDYSLIDAQEFHIVRLGGGSREVKLVRGKLARMRFPRLP
ncbi:MAG TPA: hypothetical protein VF384_13315 [Planctomycetota bacterium]